MVPERLDGTTAAIRRFLGQRNAEHHRRRCRQRGNYGAYIGYQSGSTGVATVDGVGSTWTNNGSLYVGNSGTGTLNIAAGGAVAATGVSI